MAKTKKTTSEKVTLGILPESVKISGLGPDPGEIQAIRIGNRSIGNAVNRYVAKCRPGTHRCARYRNR